MTARFFLLAALLALLPACTLLTQFDPEGQPCTPGAPAADQCLADGGYRCIGGVCTRKGSPDGG